MPASTTRWQAQEAKTNKSQHTQQRDKAWEVYAYPCIGQFRFLNLSLYKQPSYGRMLECLKAGEARYLDVGCCLGQDMRKLVFDGAPASSLYGVELEAPFIDLGYDLFRDRNTLKAEFMQGDILDVDDSSELKALQGTVDFVHLGMVLHIFDCDKQRKLLEACVSMLKPEAGCLIVGQAVGDVQGVAGPGQNGETSFKHSCESFRRIWNEIEELTGIRFGCRPSMDQGLGIREAKRTWDVSTTRRLSFEVERLG
jgi:2-polyprenyl-3-methyl-5-hydroxy-6-metoxy-1,4-benzoquinol methylase